MSRIVVVPQRSLRSYNAFVLPDVCRGASAFQVSALVVKLSFVEVLFCVFFLVLYVYGYVSCNLD